MHAKYLKFTVRNLSLKELAIFGDYQGRFYTLIWRQGDTVQSLESPGLSRRVDGTVVLTFHTFP